MIEWGSPILSNDDEWLLNDNINEKNIPDMVDQTAVNLQRP